MSSTSIGVSNSGTVFFSGVASSLDTQSLITNAVNAKLLVKKRYTDQITTNTAKITAFSTLNSQAQTLQNALLNLAKGTLNTSLNPFSTTQTLYGTSDGSNSASILTASTSNGAQAGTYSIVVGQLAKAQSVTSNVQTSATTGLGYNGTFDIGEAGKTAATITVTSTTTLNDLRNQINATTVTSGVKADILQQANGQFKLVLSGADTAKTLSVSNVTGDDVLNSLGVTNSSNGFVNEIQPPQQAQITLNNLPITSDSNNLSGVLTGLTLNLTSAAPNTTVTVQVGNNISGVSDQIKAVVDAFNTLQNTIAANKAVGADGTVDANAALYGETTNSSLGTNLTALIARTFGATGLSLRSIGLTLDGNNNLTIDQATLTSALTNNFAGVQSLFASTDSTTGIADALADQLKVYTSASTGLIQSQINNLQSIDTNLQTKADAVQASADQYQTDLINRYAKMETTIKSADILKQQITAILTGSTPVK